MSPSIRFQPIWGWFRLAGKAGWRQVMSLRRAERRLIAGLLIASLLVTVLGSVADFRTGEERVPVAGGSMIWQTNDAVAILNPLVAQTTTEQLLSALLYRGLLMVDQQRQLVPDLASGFETSTDGRRVTVHLRPGLLFHDNQPITSKDVAATIAWIKDDQNLSPLNRFWRSIAVETPDPLTVLFLLPQPYTPFPWGLTVPILPAHLSPSQPRDHLVGSGPYQARVTRQDATGIKEIRFTRAEHFYAGQPLLNELMWRKGKPYRSGTPLSVVTPVEEWVFFNTSRGKLIDRKVRQSLIDKQPLPKEATLSLFVPQDSSLERLEPYLEAWKKDGATIAIERRSVQQLERDIIPKRSYDLLFYSLIPGGDPDVYPFWHSSQIGEKGRNLSELKDKEVDRLLEEGRLTPNGPNRDALYATLKEKLEASAPGIRLQTGVTQTLSAQGVVKGPINRQGLQLAELMNDVHLLYRNEKRK